jgi:hypothetical protein
MVTKYYKFSLIFMAICCCICLIYINKTNKDKFVHTNRTIDSLKQEIFVYELMLNRYEITLEILKERDSTIAQKFEEVMSMETE